MNNKDIVRYKAFGKLVSKLRCSSVGDFASGHQVVKKFLRENIIYKAYDYPEYDFEKKFNIKEDIDCVISSEVMEHLRNPRIFLNSLSSSLKKGTKLILTTPNSAFIKYRIQLLFGKTPDTFLGPSSNLALFGKKYISLSDKKRRELDFQLHVRSYNYDEVKSILELEGFSVIKRLKLRYSGIRGFLLSILPLNFQGCHFLVAELKK